MKKYTGLFTATTVRSITSTIDDDNRTITSKRPPLQFATPSSSCNYLRIHDRQSQLVARCEPLSLRSHGSASIYDSAERRGPILAKRAVASPPPREVPLIPGRTHARGWFPWFWRGKSILSGDRNVAPSGGERKKRVGELRRGRSAGRRARARGKKFRPAGRKRQGGKRSKNSGGRVSRRSTPVNGLLETGERLPRWSVSPINSRFLPSCPPAFAPAP